ncbi:MAG: hypothetical protein ACI8YI_000795, partial [Paracoccaceae bacterium]
NTLSIILPQSWFYLMQPLDPILVQPVFIGNVYA